MRSLLPILGLVLGLGLASPSLAQDAPWVDPRALESAPQNYQGQAIQLFGQPLASALMADGTLRVQLRARVPSHLSERVSVMVDLPGGPEFLPDDHCFVIAGMANGTVTEHLRLSGAAVVVPLVTSALSRDVTTGSGDPCHAETPRYQTTPRDPNAPGINFPN